MRVIQGDIWDYIGKVDVLCITTNGFIKSNGCGVMGRGIAKEALERYPGIDKELGKSIETYGNVPCSLLTHDNTIISSFPVKSKYEVCLNDLSNIVSAYQNKFNPGDRVPGWACKAKLSIIENSSNLLKIKADSFGWKLIVLTRPGCKNGQLNWLEVEPLLSTIFDNRFMIVDKEI